MAKKDEEVEQKIRVNKEKPESGGSKPGKGSGKESGTHGSGDGPGW
jgi:hypothetical protein